MATIFTRIIDGEIPATFVYDDDQCVVFMSINPLCTGHALVVPRAEIDHWIDAPQPLREHLFNVAHRIGVAQQAAFNPVRIGMIIAGLEVPHLHLHVVPFESERDLNFANAASSVDRDELEAAAAAIKANL